MKIDFEKYNDSADLLKALAHPQRLCIVHGLMSKKCNVSTMQECLGISQSNVSQHLIKLKSAGIIAGKRQGNEICYEVVNPLAISIVQAIWNEKGEFFDENKI